MADSKTALDGSHQPVAALFDSKPISTFGSICAKISPGVTKVQSQGPDEGSPQVAELPPVEQWERYEIRNLLGRGGMGSVWKARDQRLGRMVALKFIRGDDATMVTRFQQEARAQARIQHRHICQVYEVGTVAGKPYIAMQLVEGKKLGDAAREMSLLHKVQVMSDVIFAVHEAHRLGVLHRDLKPDNIMVERREDGSFFPVVMDFGLARELHEESGLTETGAVLGTPAYMPPEQVRGDIRNLDRRSDVYSLGATLYELLCGEPPFSGERSVHILYQVLTEEPRRIKALVPGLPEELDIIVMKSLAKEPEHRYESARAFGEDLQRYTDGEPIVGKRQSLIQRARIQVRRHKGLSALALLSAMSVSVAIGVLLHGQLQRQRQEQHARKLAAEAQHLAQEIKNIEWLMRSAYQLPLHDVSKQRNLVLRHIDTLERRWRGQSGGSQALAHEALGRGYFVLQEYEKAREHLQQSMHLGNDSPGTAYAMGLTLGTIYNRAMQDAQREGDIGWYRLKKAKLREQYLPEILRYLDRGRVSDTDDTNLVAGFVAYYNDDYEQAINIARKAFDDMPWHYEAKKLEADVHHHRARADRFDGKYDSSQAELLVAQKLYDEAVAIGRSDPSIHESIAELWRLQFQLNRDRRVSNFTQLPAALQAAEHLIACAPWRAYGHVIKSSLLLFAARSDRKYLPTSLDAAKQALRIENSDFYAHDAMGAAYQVAVINDIKDGIDPRDNIAAAQSSLKKSIEMNANYAPSYSKIGNIYQNSMRWKQIAGQEGYEDYITASKYYRKALELNPDMIDVNNNLIALTVNRMRFTVARGLFSQDEFLTAESAYQSCQQKNKSFAACQISYFEVLLRKLDYQTQAGLDGTAVYERLLSLLAAFEQSHPNEYYSQLTKMEAELTWAAQLQRKGTTPTELLSTVSNQLDQCFRLHPKDTDCGELMIRRTLFLAEGVGGKSAASRKLLEEALAMADLVVADNPRSAAALQMQAETRRQLALTFLPSQWKQRKLHLEEGLLVARRGLRLNSTLPSLQLTLGKILLEQAAGNANGKERKRLAADAKTALTKALTLNKLLAREHSEALRRADELLQ